MRVRSIALTLTTRTLATRTVDCGAFARRFARNVKPALCARGSIFTTIDVVHRKFSFYFASFFSRLRERREGERDETRRRRERSGSRRGRAWCW